MAAQPHRVPVALLPMTTHLTQRCLSATQSNCVIKTKRLSNTVVYARELPILHGLQFDQLTSPHLPSFIAQNVDAIRHIGNFAAHPTKSQASGEIVEVEAGEAEWNLDVLDLLFDFYYVQPKIAQQKRDDLNKKLRDSGKLPMK
jgi:hypothetical protein